MARDGDDPVPDDLRPCQAFVASDAFQAWAVERMRREVQRQISGAGLDRMALLKGQKGRKDTNGAGKAGGP